MPISSGLCSSRLLHSRVTSEYHLFWAPLVNRAELHVWTTISHNLVSALAEFGHWASEKFLRLCSSLTGLNNIFSASRQLNSRYFSGLWRIALLFLSLVPVWLCCQLLNRLTVYQYCSNGGAWYDIRKYIYRSHCCYSVSDFCQRRWFSTLRFRAVCMESLYCKRTSCRLTRRDARSSA
jgi:hypothetical protein